METCFSVIVLARKAQVVLHRAKLDLDLAKGQIADISGQLVLPKVKPADPSRRITAVARRRAGGVGAGEIEAAAQLALAFSQMSTVRLVPSLLAYSCSPGPDVVAEAPFKLLICSLSDAQPCPGPSAAPPAAQRLATGYAPDGSAHPRRTPPARPGYCAGSPDVPLRHSPTRREKILVVVASFFQIFIVGYLVVDEFKQ